MRKRFARFAVFGASLLFFFVLSARPSHAACGTGGDFNTPYLVFGQQPLNTSGLTQTATLTFSTGCGSQVSPVAVTNISVTVNGNNGGDFSAAGNGTVPCNAGTVLDVYPGVDASCTLGAMFTATAPGTRTAMITVTFDVSTGINDGPVTLNVVGGDEVVYVTTGSGGQVLTVDGANQNVFQVLSNGPCNTAGCFQPTGTVVGPDGKIYMTDQVNSTIWRMNRDGSQLEEIYTGGADCSGACEPEGPSFSGTGAGDLYFNTFVSGGGLYEIAGAANAPFGGPFNAPTVVESCDPGHNNQNCPYGGTGTAFDASGNLIAADQENGDIWSLVAPYSPSTPPTAILTDTSNQVSINLPTGIALNKANGQIYVANSDGLNSQSESTADQILQIVPPATQSSPYTTTPYYTFTTTSAACSNTSDFPDYMQFDMTGYLFVVTSVSPQPGGANNCGKVWSINPGGSSATLLLDLNAVFSSGIAGVCGSAACGLNGTQAVGLAIPPTTGTTQTVGLSAGGGTATVGWPIGCMPTNTPPNNCSSTIGIQYPAGMFGPGDMLNVTFAETTQAQFMANTAGTPYANNTLAPVEGYNGGGLVPSLSCTNGGSPCGDINPSNYDIFTTWQSNQTSYCSLVPHLLKGDPAGGPYSELLVDTLVSCSDGSVGTKGQSSCSSGSTSTSKCLSDWPNSFGPVTGPTSGITATETISSPTNGASFLLNQPATATFTCTPNTIVSDCVGTVTNPAYVDSNGNPIVQTVTSGGPLPTAHGGMNTLAVNAEVDGGTPGNGAMAQYTVVPCQNVSLAFNPATVAVGKSTTVMTTLQSCTSKAEIAVIQFNLTGPLGKNCGTLMTPELSLPVILGTKPISFNFPLKIPNGACTGTYTVSSNTYVKGALIGTTSSSLIVTH